MMMDLFNLKFSMISFCFILSGASYDDLWRSYKVKYEKFYEGKDEAYRREIWEETIPVIAKHNLEAEFGLHSFRLGLNKFTDMTVTEFNVYRRCLSQRYDSQETFDRYFECDWNCFASLPSRVDWREKGFVTPIKDQKDCGSCWAFSSTGSLEGQIKAKLGVLTPLSEQNLVDCSGKQGNHGCDGGWMDYAFQYVIDNEGIDSEKAYPYKAKRKHCEFVRSGVAGNCTKYLRIPKGSEKHLQAAVANIGPIAVAIDVEDKFMSYSNGIYFDKDCQSQYLGHAVLLVVGYGEMNGTDYWIVKNSWGPSWGMDGYILMRRNANNMCGIATHAVYPVV